MKAMVLTRISDLRDDRNPLEMREVADPVPGEREVLLKVLACGVCHTELDEIEGRTPPPRLPVIPGHQVVGRIEETGGGGGRFKKGDRVGVAWIYSACGRCKFCRTGRENLCVDFRATGRDVDGGYAEYMTVSQDFAYAIPEVFSDIEAAPLLCAGAIGYRSLQLTGLRDGQRLGLTGFGASGHLVLLLVKHKFPKAKVFVFARAQKEREFARELGAVWTGDTDDASPEKLDAVIDTTPVWKPVVEALRNLDAGGRLVVNAIRKENVDQDYLLKLDYPVHLWMEKEIKSVANVTRADVSEFLKLAAEIPIRPEVEVYPLEEANRALLDIKERRIRGAKVLKV
jgi:propanol-preferring alcohol dehydrogenase